MTQLVRNCVVVTFLIALVCVDAMVAVGFLPKRPDSAAFFIALGFYCVGIVLANAVLSPQRPRVVALGKQLQMLAFGAAIVGMVLFLFGGYRAASIGS